MELVYESLHHVCVLWVEVECLVVGPKCFGLLPHLLEDLAHCYVNRCFFGNYLGQLFEDLEALLVPAEGLQDGNLLVLGEWSTSVECLCLCEALEGILALVTVGEGHAQVCPQNS